MTTEGLPGVLKSLWIALGCRILFGAIAGWLWKLFKKLTKQDFAALPLTAAVSTLCHTILVMGSIYVLLSQARPSDLPIISKRLEAAGLQYRLLDASQQAELLGEGAEIAHV